MERIPGDGRFEPTERHSTGAETKRFVGAKPDHVHEVAPHRHTDDSPPVALGELGREGAELLSTSTFAECIVALSAYKRDHHEDLLGVSAEEIEGGVSALTQRFEKEMVTQGFTSSRALHFLESTHVLQMVLTAKREKRSRHSQCVRSLLPTSQKRLAPARSLCRPRWTQSTLRSYFSTSSTKTCPRPPSKLTSHVECNHLLLRHRHFSKRWLGSVC